MCVFAERETAGFGGPYVHWVFRGKEQMIGTAGSNERGEEKRRVCVRVCMVEIRIYHPVCLFVSACVHPHVCEFVAASLCVSARVCV